MQGDRNIAFFYMSTLIKRKRNKITTIKNSVGEWLLDEKEVKDYVQKGFQDIYTSSHILPLGLHLPPLGGKPDSQIPLRIV